MKTVDAITTFLEDARGKGLSPNTVNQYWSYLRHLPDEYAELPTTMAEIEAYLRRRGEGPGNRGNVHRRLQAFYAFLARAKIVTSSPVPPSAPMGRPRKGERHNKQSQKVVMGGGSDFPLQVTITITVTPGSPPQD